MWCWRRLLRVTWTARTTDQSILKEINPEYSLEGLTLKLQYFGHLMQRADSLEKTQMLGKFEDKRRKKSGGGRTVGDRGGETKGEREGRSDTHLWNSVDTCCCSATQSCLTLCDPIFCSTPGIPVLHHLPQLAQTHVHRVGDAIQPSHLCCPLRLPPSIFPSIRVFSNESALCIRWPKYWSFSFNISPSNEHLGLISLWIDWLDLLAVQRTLKSLL